MHFLLEVDTALVNKVFNYEWEEQTRKTRWIHLLFGTVPSVFLKISHKGTSATTSVALILRTDVMHFVTPDISKCDVSRWCIEQPAWL
jgi:hypothetical protein